MGQEDVSVNINIHISMSLCRLSHCAVQILVEWLHDCVVTKENQESHSWRYGTWMSWIKNNVNIITGDDNNDNDNDDNDNDNVDDENNNNNDNNKR